MHRQIPRFCGKSRQPNFTGFETELGDLARLAYATLGWDEIARNEGLDGLEVLAPAAAPALPPALNLSNRKNSPRFK